ncbi:PhnA domain-containing protein [Streptomyces sp. NPDC017254]
MPVDLVSTGISRCTRRPWDAVGTVLNDGDTVTVVKALKSSVVKKA